MSEHETRLIQLPADATDEEILTAVRKWCKAVSEEDFEGALAMVRSPGWTADLLQRTISSYDGYAKAGEQCYKLSSLDTARYRPGDEPVNNPFPRHDVNRDGDYISVWFDLPLNGYWSELTATFDVNTEDKHLVLSLQMVHVM